MNTEEGNKLIAEFMGYEFTETPDCGILVGNKFTRLPKKDNTPPFTVYHGWCPPKYHSSWGLLMPVVEKIEDLGFDFCIMKKAVFIRRQFDYWEVNNNPNKIKAVREEIVKFIQWYNENK